MPTTPIHGNKNLTDSDADLVAQPDPQAPVTKEGVKLAIANHKTECHEQGALFQVNEKVDKLRLWVAGATVLGFIATVAAPVILGWWLSSRLPAPSQHRAVEAPSLFNQAHAEAKGAP